LQKTIGFWFTEVKSSWQKSENEKGEMAFAISPFSFSIKNPFSGFLFLIAGHPDFRKSKTTNY
jgi:hypothetical protein